MSLLRPSPGPATSSKRSSARADRDREASFAPPGAAPPDLLFPPRCAPRFAATTEKCVARFAGSACFNHSDHWRSPPTAPHSGTTTNPQGCPQQLRCGLRTPGDGDPRFPRRSRWHAACSSVASSGARRNGSSVVGAGPGATPDGSEPGRWTLSETEASARSSRTR